MKKLTLLTLFVLFVFGIGNSQTFGRNQATLNIKKTADWCTFCGQYGWTYFKQIKADNPNNPSIQIANHYSGGLSNDIAIDLNANFQSGGQPVFFVNGEDQFVGSSNVAAKAAAYKTFVEAQAKLTPDFYTKLTITKNGTANVATVEVESTKATTGDYTVSLFLLRDNFIWTQASQGANASHTNVLDKQRITPTTFGPTIVSGSNAAGTKKSLVQSFPALTPHSSNLADMKIAAILWKKEANGAYTYVNGTITTMAQITTSTLEEVAAINAKAYQSGSKLILTSDKKIDLASIKLFNTAGQSISLLFSADNETSYSADLSRINAGVYIVQYTSNNVTGTTKVMISK